MKRAIFLIALTGILAVIGCSKNQETATPGQPLADPAFPSSEKSLVDFQFAEQLSDGLLTIGGSYCPTSLTATAAFSAGGSEFTMEILEGDASSTVAFDFGDHGTMLYRFWAENSQLLECTITDCSALENDLLYLALLDLLDEYNDRNYLGLDQETMGVLAQLIVLGPSVVSDCRSWQEHVLMIGYCGTNFYYKLQSCQNARERGGSDELLLDCQRDADRALLKCMVEFHGNPILGVIYSNWG